ncbi:hypothetical protein [Microtetraspora sp. NBRC 16547]|uniref:hypothetical protein n=1 Tax=Microtetraspora sp. NBRC 16547 TaxID=3030993 RepID=UPI0024A3EE10|nr:hypothetical protein [Microtetraspora sp. NBRC 16547]GLW97609.1 hypothetical protein Misp02_16960 [Microtetraspora sp. NBRC 16547]
MFTRGRVPFAVATLVTITVTGCAQVAQGATAQQQTTTGGARAAQSAPTRTVYGFARPDGTGAMIISPRKVQLKSKRYQVRPLVSAKDVRVTFGRSLDYRRVTTACDLKETEGKVAIDAKGLGTTRCTDKDLSFTLGLGPVPVKVTYDPGTGAATQAREFLYAPQDPRTAFGEVTPSGAGAVVFTPYAVKRVPKTGYSFTKRSGAPVTLVYTGLTPFFRVSATCADESFQPTNADSDGVGTLQCRNTDLARVLGARKEMQVKLDYLPASGEIAEVREVYPCQGAQCAP